MKKYFKLITILGLLLLIVGCSNTKDNGENRVKKNNYQRKDSNNKNCCQKRNYSENNHERFLRINEELNKYIKTGISEEFSENELLSYFFVSTMYEFKIISQDLKEQGFKYEDIDKAMEYIRRNPGYEKGFKSLIEDGYNSEEVKKITTIFISIHLLYNEYADKGIRLEEDISTIIDSDERVKQHIKDFIILTYK